ncbi:hypothetical protein DFH28DRAFT_1087003 [Melampsora americana]|nr:hypothetical protein DFH28DRAFT_1087003 [Melampsora americana]
MIRLGLRDNSGDLEIRRAPRQQVSDIRAMTMSLALSFSLAQLALLGQAVLLHPAYRTSQTARLLRLGLIPLAFSLLASFAMRRRAQSTFALDIATNIFIGPMIAVTALRSLIWGTSSKPYYRSKDSEAQGSFLDKLAFGVSLLSSPRGIGWSFGVPLQPVNQTKTDFLRDTLRRLSGDLFIFASSVVILAIIDSSPYATTSIFRYLTTFFSGTLSWTMLDSAGCFVRLGALLFGLDLSEYTFWLDSPIRSTNLADFWSRKWHSLLRHVFVEGGAKPCEAIVQKLIGNGVLSRSAGLIGAFAISGLIHEFGLWFATTPDFSFRTTAFFVSQGLGVVLESTFSKLTGGRVGGWIGRIWMLLWLVGWGRLMIDSWLDQGVVDSSLMRAYLSDHGYL